MLRVWTGPECPEDNLRELTRDSNPNCGIAKEEKRKERERERTSATAWPIHRTKDRANTGGELAGCRLATPPTGGREAGGRQPKPEGKGQS